MIQTAHMRVLMASLRDAGVDELIVSPGSRSTPAIAAARAVGLRMRAVIDERSAAHLALGQARITGKPSALLCTSGSAAACYLPAVVEASLARIPLVVITADRPPELQGCEAPQTIDQVHLYGDFVRRFIDLGPPAADPASLRATRRRAAQAVFHSRFPEPGPVHLNAPARKPLEPREPEGEVAAALERALARPITRADAPAVVAAHEAVGAIARACSQTPRGVITCGPAPLAAAGWRDAVRTLAERTGYPVLAEATSQQRLVDSPRVCGAFDLLYSVGAFRDGATPDLVIQIGAPPVSAAWSALLERARPRRVAVTDHGWPDPQGDLDILCRGDVADALSRIATRVSGTRDPAWCERFARADDRAWRQVETELGREAEPMLEGQAVRAAIGAVPDGALIAVGNSLPVRAIDTYVAPGAARAEVLSQRGASGIDGVVSGAIGAASVTDRPLLVLVGDVSFAHDIGALAAARELVAPLCILVVDNRGGRIFERLPVAGAPALSPAFEALWLTPPPLDIVAAARAYGLEARATDSARAVADAVAEALAGPGVTVIRAEVEPGSAQASHQRLLAALAKDLR